MVVFAFEVFCGCCCCLAEANNQNLPSLSEGCSGSGFTLPLFWVTCGFSDLHTHKCTLGLKESISGVSAEVNCFWEIWANSAHLVLLRVWEKNPHSFLGGKNHTHTNLHTSSGGGFIYSFIYFIDIVDFQCCVSFSVLQSKSVIDICLFSTWVFWLSFKNVDFWESFLYLWKYSLDTWFLYVFSHLVILFFILLTSHFT